MDCKFDNYDLKKLEEADKVLQKVLEYYYGHNPTKKYWKRLDTIVIKLNQLIDMHKE